jgi:hypothetical protein
MKRISQLIFNTSKSSQKPLVFLESVSSKISTCGVHDENQFPNVKALEMCASCHTGMCYMCANEHADKFHTIDWGFDIFNVMEPPRNELNETFNAGHRATLDLTKLKCPCGNPIIGNKSSTFCAACGTATCSAECHDKFCQAPGKCLFIRNFVTNDATNKIQGLRTILWINQFAMMRDNHPPGTSFSMTSPKFMTALLGPTKSTIYL